MALNYFEQLLKKTNEEQQKEIEEFIADNESFTIYTGLAQRVQPPKTMLREYPQKKGKAAAKPAIKADTDSYASESANKQGGLSWAMALARVELASVLATFTPIPDPFVSVRPTQFELPAYKELLLDGVAMHYWTLSKDPATKRVTSVSPDDPTVLAYSRRLSLSRKMLRGLAKASVGDLRPLQYRELASWNRNLDRLHLEILTTIQAYLATRTAGVGESNEEFTARGADGETSFEQACMTQLHAEKRLIESGQAKTVDYSSSGR